MEEEAQPRRDDDGDALPNHAAATGWDPYQVWLTRIRPYQSLIEQSPAAPQRQRRATPALFRFHL